MCVCGKPTINGQPGYKWQPNDLPNVYPVNPPKLNEDDKLLYDEPGRCGGGRDSHSYHFRVVDNHGTKFLLVRHGGGDECISLGSGPGAACLESMDSDARYWLLQMIYRTQYNASRKARDDERAVWSKAAVEKRIKLRRRQKRVYVEVLPERKAI